MNKNIILFGTNYSAKMAHYILEKQGMNVLAFSIHQAYMKEDTFLGLPVVPLESLASAYSPDQIEVHVAIGPSRMNDLREEVCAQVKKLGFSLRSVIHESATLTNAIIDEENTRIGEKVLIQPYCHIGKNVVISAGCLIGHDSVVEDNCFIAAGVITGGAVVIKKNSFIGTGAVLRSNITIGEKSIIGAGVTLLESSAPGEVFMNIGAQKLDIPSHEIQF
jgi:sugar O-acyltransferase (sialic acid O-acetyltransferase NeuD family)